MRDRVICRSLGQDQGGVGPMSRKKSPSTFRGFQPATISLIKVLLRSFGAYYTACLPVKHDAAFHENGEKFPYQEVFSRIPMITCPRRTNADKRQMKCREGYGRPACNSHYLPAFDRDELWGFLLYQPYYRVGLDFRPYYQNSSRDWMRTLHGLQVQVA